MRRLPLLLGLHLSLALGCSSTDVADADPDTGSTGTSGSDSGTSSEQPACTTDLSEARIGLPAMCLEDIRVSALRDEAWVALDPADALKLAELDGGAVRLVAAASGPVRALRVELPGLRVRRMLQQGYQSWSFAGTVELPAKDLLIASDGAPQLEEILTGDPFYTEQGVSFHAAVFGNAEGPKLVAGALGATRAVTGFVGLPGEAQAVDVAILYGPAREVLSPDADGMTRSEPLYLGTAEDASAGLRALGDARIAEHPESREPLPPPGGWFSWNEHFDEIDAEIVRANIEVVQTELAPQGLPLVEIDDGWQVAWGDWTSNAKFPEGIEALGSEIVERGLVAGIWMAPFLVEVGADTAMLDDAFFVQDPGTGERLEHVNIGNDRRFYVLDATNPEAMAVVLEPLAALREAGYRFFKLDFLYAGALPGRRVKDVTGLEALREGLEKIRATVGDDAVINACGAPTLPMIGLADSLRIGADTTFGELQWPFVAFAARNLAVRAHLHPQIWPDADQVQMRPPYSLEDAKVGAVVAALAGPAYSLGDDLALLDSQRLAVGLQPELLDLAGGTPGRALDLMDVAGPIYVNPAFDAVFEPNGTGHRPPSVFEARGGSGSEYRIEFDWEGHTVEVTSR